MWRVPAMHTSVKAISSFCVLNYCCHSKSFFFFFFFFSSPLLGRTYCLELNSLFSLWKQCFSTLRLQNFPVTPAPPAPFFFFFFFIWETWKKFVWCLCMLCFVFVEWLVLWIDLTKGLCIYIYMRSVLNFAFAYDLSLTVLRWPCVVDRKLKASLLTNLQNPPILHCVQCHWNGWTADSGLTQA